LVRTPFDAAPKEVTFEPELVTAPLKLAFVVTVAAFPPILMVVVETKVFAPLRKLRMVPGVGVPKRVEVAMVVTFPVAPVLLPRTVPALIVGSCASVRALFAIPSVTFAPPT
jgi:hypothetical protein